MEHKQLYRHILEQVEGYENNHQELNEDSKLGGIDPYSASKSCQDILSECYNLRL